MSSAPETVGTPDVSDAPLPIQSDSADIQMARSTRRKKSKMLRRRSNIKSNKSLTNPAIETDQGSDTTQSERNLLKLPHVSGVPLNTEAGPSIQRKRSATMMTETNLTIPRPTKVQRDSAEATGDEGEVTSKAKATRRGKRSGQHVKSSRAQARVKKSGLSNAEQARNIIRMLDALEQPITETPEDQLTNEEVVDIATGHGVNKGRKEIVVDTVREGKRWRTRHNIEIDQFKDRILSDEQIRKLKFRLFTHGVVWGYRKNNEGKHELVFSVIFHFFDDMSDSELDDFAFLGGFFASLQGGPKLDTNKYMDGGTMFGLGWRGGTDGDFRLGWYARHPDTDWAKHHRDECRVAAIYNRMFLQQSRYIHRLATETINRLRLPRLSDRQLGEGKSELPAANLTCTCQDFRNKMHRDEDASDWTFGLWFPTRANGQLVRKAEEVEKMTQGGAFVFPNLGMGVDFSKCPGVVSILWQGPHELHGTVESKTNPTFRRWGTSIQCTNRLTKRVELHAAMLEGKLVKDGRPIRALKINDYYARSSMPRPKPKYRWWVDDMYGEEVDEGQDTEDEEEMEHGDPDDEMEILWSNDENPDDSDYEPSDESDGDSSY
ncbi:hypothetical protein RhiJN_03854 [Ceratobasidium sp. AG-Ba]|nr:hypothetical protein RhiJN_03854 [Ceratobasidium sp. AG-Ba]